MGRRYLACILTLLLSLGVACEVKAQSCAIPTFVVPQTFFGITQNSLNNPLASAAFNIGYGRLWDTTCVWPLIETSNGVFTWTTGSNCDAYFNWIINNGGVPSFVLGRTPLWALDLTSVNKVNVTAGGSGYTSPPTVSFSGGGGSGLTATANLTGAAVTSITITNPGTGYTSAPSVSFSGGGGSGAIATTTLLTCTSGYGTGCSQAPKDTNSGGAILTGFVNALVAHLASTHPGVHLVIESVNEADLLGEWNGAAGTSDRIQDLVTFGTTLRTAAHAADPQIIVLGPSGSSVNTSNVHLYSDGNGFANKPGAAASLDAINIHAYLQSCGTYCGTPEPFQQSMGQINALRALGAPLAGKPIYITEANWGGKPPSNNLNFTDTVKGQFLMRMHMYAFINNFSSFMWYAYDSHPDDLGNVGAFGTLCVGNPANTCTPNRAAVSLATLEAWLVGATFLQAPCVQDTNATWSCTLQTSHASTGPAMIIFNGNSSHSFTVPAIYTKVLNWDGSNTAIVSHSITAGPDVVMAIP